MEVSFFSGQVAVIQDTHAHTLPLYIFVRTKGTTELRNTCDKRILVKYVFLWLIHRDV